LLALLHVLTFGAFEANIMTLWTPLSPDNPS